MNLPEVQVPSVPVIRVIAVQDDWPSRRYSPTRLDVLNTSDPSPEPSELSRMKIGIERDVVPARILDFKGTLL